MCFFVVVVGVWLSGCAVVFVFVVWLWGNVVVAVCYIELIMGKTLHSPNPKITSSDSDLSFYWPENVACKLLFSCKITVVSFMGKVLYSHQR